MLNVHGSILPKWRGAAPIPHSIMNGDTSTGISIMRIRPLHFDVGEVLATRDFLELTNFPQKHCNTFTMNLCKGNPKKLSSKKIAVNIPSF